MNWKNTITPNQVSDQLISSIDIAPTILKVADIAVPSEMVGKSLFPFMKGKDKHIHEYVFSERNWHGIDEHMRSIRSLKYKLITNGYEDKPFGFPSDLSDSPSWQTLYVKNKSRELTDQQKRIFEYPRPKVELYDIANDADEIINLAGIPKYKKIEYKMLKTLQKWQLKTNDVSQNDHVPADKTDRITCKPLNGNNNDEE